MTSPSPKCYNRIQLWLLMSVTHLMLPTTWRNTPSLTRSNASNLPRNTKTWWNNLSNTLVSKAWHSKMNSKIRTEQSLTKSQIHNLKGYLKPTHWTSQKWNSTFWRKYLTTAWTHKTTSTKLPSLKKSKAWTITHSTRIGRSKTEPGTPKTLSSNLKSNHSLRHWLNCLTS